VPRRQVSVKDYFTGPLGETGSRAIIFPRPAKFLWDHKSHCFFLYSRVGRGKLIWERNNTDVTILQMPKSTCTGTAGDGSEQRLLSPMYFPTK
jgi:hypothetical protein